jgi:hypothetical protein
LKRHGRSRINADLWTDSATWAQWWYPASHRDGPGIATQRGPVVGHAFRILVLVSAADVIGTTANVATAAGISLVAYQLYMTRQQMVADFERTFVDRYEGIIRDVPLALLLGEPFDPHHDDRVLRAFFDYFELCEEEMYYRRIGKVSRSTWCDWWEGIALNLRRPAFRAAWNHLADRVTVSPGPRSQVRATQFELLRDAVRAIDEGLMFDPHP